MAKQQASGSSIEMVPIELFGVAKPMEVRDNRKTLEEVSGSLISSLSVSIKNIMSALNTVVNLENEFVNDGNSNSIMAEDLTDSGFVIIPSHTEGFAAHDEVLCDTSDADTAVHGATLCDISDTGTDVHDEAPCDTSDTVTPVHSETLCDTTTDTASGQHADVSRIEDVVCTTLNEGKYMTCPVLTDSDDSPSVEADGLANADDPVLPQETDEATNVSERINDLCIKIINHKYPDSPTEDDDLAIEGVGDTCNLLDEEEREVDYRLKAQEAWSKHQKHKSKRNKKLGCFPKKWWSCSRDPSGFSESDSNEDNMLRDEVIDNTNILSDNVDDATSFEYSQLSSANTDNKRINYRQDISETNNDSVTEINSVLFINTSDNTLHDRDMAFTSPGISDNINHVPANINKVPDNVNQGPDNINQVPDNINQAPPNINQVPDNVNQVPDNINQKPSNINQVPNNINQKPDNINQKPDKINQKPDNINQVPIKHAGTSRRVNDVRRSNSMVSDFLKFQAKYYSPKSTSTESVNTYKTDSFVHVPTGQHLDSNQRIMYHNNMPVEDNYLKCKPKFHSTQDISEFHSETLKKREQGSFDHDDADLLHDGKSPRTATPHHVDTNDISNKSKNKYYSTSNISDLRSKKMNKQEEGSLVHISFGGGHGIYLGSKTHKPPGNSNT